MVRVKPPLTSSPTHSEWEAQGKIKVTIVRTHRRPHDRPGRYYCQPGSHCWHHRAECRSNRRHDMRKILAGQAPPEVLDKDNIAYFGLDADSLTDQVVYALINLGRFNRRGYSARLW